MARFDYKNSKTKNGNATGKDVDKILNSPYADYSAQELIEIINKLEHQVKSAEANSVVKAAEAEKACKERDAKAAEAEKARKELDAKAAEAEKARKELDAKAADAETEGLYLEGEPAKEFAARLMNAGIKAFRNELKVEMERYKKEQRRTEIGQQIDGLTDEFAKGLKAILSGYSFEDEA